MSSGSGLEQTAQLAPEAVSAGRARHFVRAALQA